MFWHVFKRASQCPQLSKIVLATDDNRIVSAANNLNVPTINTRDDHVSGTDRVLEAAELLNVPEDAVVVNIQGDEPLIQPEQLQTLMDCIQTPGTDIATLIRPLKSNEELKNPNVVKVVVDQLFRALYFSRASIPFVRSSGAEQKPTNLPFYTHIGLYAFRREILEQVVNLPPSALEQAESLEQLRWMEHGITIRTAITHLPSLGVDTPEDLEKISKEGSF